MSPLEAAGAAGKPLTTPEERDGTLSDLVYQDVRRRIISGDLASGTAVRLDDVAKKVGVSPTPAREALARLESTGLIRYEPRRGYRVAPPLAGKQLEDLMDARELLQVAAARLAALQAGEALADSLDAVISRQENAIAALREQQARSVPNAELEGASWEVVEAEMSFHDAVVEHSQNAFVSLMANTLAGQSHRSRHSVVRALENLEHSLEEHRTIARAARYGDSESVAAAMLMHLRMMRHRVTADAEAVDG